MTGVPVLSKPEWTDVHFGNSYRLTILCGKAVVSKWTQIPHGAPSNCCIPNPAGLPGCDVGACEAVVCAADPFCCDVAWDGICGSHRQASALPGVTASRT